MSKVKDITGVRFGRLVALRYLPSIKKWECMCDCGNITYVLSQNLNSGHTKSCGCYKKEKNHGLKGTRIYRIWLCMKTRCYNSNYEHFNRYGGRGIEVCKEWKNDFLAFYKWSIENGYSENLSIDRKDVNKGYSPDNCRWITMSDQQSNTSRNRYIVINGVKKTVTQWSITSGVKVETICSRLSKGESGISLLRKADQKYNHKSKNEATYE